MIAAIAYFGITNPQKFLPNRCNFGSEFQCIDYQISSSDTFNIMLKNNAGFPAIISAITLGSETQIQYTCTNPTLPFTMNPGNTTIFAFTSCNTAAAGFSQGNKAKVLMKITYANSASPSFQKLVQGEVYAAVT